MYSKYFNFSRQVVKTFSSSNQYTLLFINNENYVAKRWAGHSKWMNTKSIKQVMNRAKSENFQRLSSKITLAVKHGGPDLSLNSKLKSVYDEAIKLNMPKSTFENMVKRALVEKAIEPYWSIFLSSSGLLLGLEVTFKNEHFLLGEVGSTLSKMKLKLQPHFNDLVNQKGIIIADPPQDQPNSYEKAVENAIEIGVDEVFEGENKRLIFECLPDRLYSLSQQLSDRGYDVQSASSELDFKEFIKMNDEQLQLLEKAIEILKKNEKILRISHNVESE